MKKCEELFKQNLFIQGAGKADRDNDFKKNMYTEVLYVVSNNCHVVENP